MQQEFHSDSLVDETPTSRIRVMPRKRGETGPYRRHKRPDTPRTTSNFIREHREALDMTQEDLADESGISLSSISAYERGDVQPSLDALEKLSKALGVPRGVILDVNPNDDPPLWASVLKATSRPAVRVKK